MICNSNISYLASELLTEYVINIMFSEIGYKINNNKVDKKCHKLIRYDTLVSELLNGDS